MGLGAEFKKFAMRGNVVDLAVGVVVGGAFGKITSSLVNDVIMPPVGFLVGGVDFSSLAITLRPASEGVQAITIGYGAFINTILDFVIIAFAVFMLLKGINSLHITKKPDAPAKLSKQEVLLTEIRDALQAR